MGMKNIAAHLNDQEHKPVTVSRRLAMRARLPCYVLLYRCGASANPADPQWLDITSFRIKRVWPREERAWRTLDPGEWAQALLQIRAWASARIDREAANEPRY